jgi:hypothetical protein
MKKLLIDNEDIGMDNMPINFQFLEGEHSVNPENYDRFIEISSHNTKKFVPFAFYKPIVKTILFELYDVI